VKEGDVAKLENAVLLGKGKLIIGKKAWNEKTRKFIKTVPDLMVSFKRSSNYILLVALFKKE
jgi:hypothetical protein